VAVLVVIVVVVAALAAISGYYVIGNRAVDRSVSVSISPSSQSGATGATLNYTVTVTNTGDVLDNYSLTVSDTANWLTSISPTALELDAGSTGSSTLTVTVPSLIVTGPSDEVSGIIDNVTVTANGTGDNDSSTCAALVLLLQP
jgi:uncharacterized membrane protein